MFSTFVFTNEYLPISPETIVDILIFLNVHHFFPHFTENIIIHMVCTPLFTITNSCCSTELKLKVDCYNPIILLPFSRFISQEYDSPCLSYLIIISQLNLLHMSEGSILQVYLLTSSMWVILWLSKSIFPTDRVNSWRSFTQLKSKYYCVHNLVTKLKWNRAFFSSQILSTAFFEYLSHCITLYEVISHELFYTSLHQN